MSNKKAISPLIATILLVVFALIIGTATMSWSKNYVEGIPDEGNNAVGSSYVISKDEVSDNPLKKLQINYIYDLIDLDTYLTKEQEVVQDMKKAD